MDPPKIDLSLDYQQLNIPEYYNFDYSSWRTFKYNYKNMMRGEDVKQLQITLNQLGANLQIDGSYGPATEGAVLDYQKGQGLSTDGIVGSNTKMSIMGALGVGETYESYASNKGINNYDEYKLFVSTIYGEAANSSKIAWESIGFVIKNRISYREWKKYNTVESVIKNTGFDAYTHKTSLYKEADSILSGIKDKNQVTLNKMFDVLLPVYMGTKEDITVGAVMYYSPKAQNILHKKDPLKYKQTPPWNFNLLKEVTSNIGLEPTDDFKFYKYK